MKKLYQRQICLNNGANLLKLAKISTRKVQDKYKKKYQIYFPVKKNIQFQEPLINHSTFVDQYEILAIPCGLSKLIKIEISSEADRECKKCLEYIVTKLELEETETTKNVIVNNIFQNQLQKENNIFNICFPLNKNEHTFFFSKVKVTNYGLKKIFNATLDQSKSVDWIKERSIRISATKAHKIKTCKCISDENLVKLANTMSIDTNLIGKAAINTAYGLRTEGVAIEAYNKMFKVKTVRAGLTIHSKYPWLCASPDALVLSQNGNINKILEIKCPISCRNKLIFDEDSKICNLSYLKYENDEIVLKSSHQYYTQCQIIMFVTGLDKCDLFIYNSIKPLLICLEKDELFLKKVILKLEYFYFNYFLPNIILSSNK